MQNRFVAVGLALGLLLGCSSGTEGSAGALPTSPATADAGTQKHLVVPIPRTALRPARQLGADVGGRLLSMPWELVDVRRGGRVLVVSYVSGDGIHPHGVNNIGFRVIEGSGAVELIAVSRDEKRSDNGDLSLAFGSAKIVLSKPLGARKLLHAPTAPGWPATLLTGA